MILVVLDSDRIRLLLKGLDQNCRRPDKVEGRSLLCSSDGFHINLRHLLSNTMLKPSISSTHAHLLFYDTANKVHALNKVISHKEDINKTSINAKTVFLRSFLGLVVKDENR